MTIDSVTSSTPESLTGRVKWFNNKAGFGFITVTEGNRSGSDIFVHHSNVEVAEQQYRYLVQGEYVQFVLTATEGGKHPFQASNVCGINGGKLMCETRNENKTLRRSYKPLSTTTNDENVLDSAPPVKETRPQGKTPRPRGEGPRDSTSQKWTVVEGTGPAKRRGRPPHANVAPSEST
jgi:cold shock CspA family protein